MRARHLPALLTALVLAGCRLPLPSPSALEGDAGQGERRLDQRGGEASSCALPDPPGPNNTGVPPGTTLTPLGTPGQLLVLDQASEVVSDREIKGPVEVRAKNVTLRRCRITTSDARPLRVADGASLVVEDTEIAGGPGGEGIGYGYFEARRLNVHGTSDGIAADEHAVIEACWIHDLAASGGGMAGVFSTGGSTVTVHGNTITGDSGHSAIAARNDNGAVQNLTVEANLLDAGKTIVSLSGNLQGTRVIGNRFGRSGTPLTCCGNDPSSTVQGNLYADTCAPVPGQ